MRCSRSLTSFSEVPTIGVDVDRAHDRVEVGAHVAAVSGKDVGLVREAVGLAVKLVYCAYFAAMRKVFCSPPPAIHSGIPLSCNGFGSTIAPSTW